MLFLQKSHSTLPPPWKSRTFHEYDSRHGTSSPTGGSGMDDTLAAFLDYSLDLSPKYWSLMEKKRLTC